MRFPASWGGIPAPGPLPLLVSVRRGPLTESLHQVNCVIADADGHIVKRWGNIDDPIFPRSAIKMLQSLPFVETGAADRFSCDVAEFALACASHGGEIPDAERSVVGCTAWAARPMTWHAARTGRCIVRQSVNLQLRDRNQAGFTTTAPVSTPACSPRRCILGNPSRAMNILNTPFKSGSWRCLRSSATLT